MLTPKQRQYLKAEAHHLKPVLHVGKGGLSEALFAEVDGLLERQELIKIKVNQNAAEDEARLIEELAAKVPGLIHVWTIGHTMLVFRPSRERETRYPLPG